MKRLTTREVLGIVGVFTLFLVLGFKYARWEMRKEKEAQAPLQTDCPHTFISWNMENFGKGKSDETIETMARIVCSQGDIIAAQEITAGKNFGAQAVAKLAASCSRMGSDWDYIVSDPTKPASPGVERYAYLWKKNLFSMNHDQAHLVRELEEAIDREPYSVTFNSKKTSPFTLFTMHALPTEKGPLAEIRALEGSTELRSIERAIFSGDFNLDKKATDPSFNALGFTAHIDQPTSLKSKLSGEHYKVKQYDNIYTKEDIRVCTSGVIDFVEKRFSPVTQDSLREARKVSDHLPVYITFK